MLLPTLDLYVLDDDIHSVQDQLIPFKPTHPNTSFFLSKKNNNNEHFIEVYNSYAIIMRHCASSDDIFFFKIFSTKYLSKEHGKWSMDIYSGLHINKRVSANEIKGKYWLDVLLGKATTTRYFRLFVTSKTNSIGKRAYKSNNCIYNFHCIQQYIPVTHWLFVTVNQPVIMRAVDFLIYPNGSSFSLICQISLPWNITWILPNLLQVSLNVITKFSMKSMGPINLNLWTILGKFRSELLSRRQRWTRSRNNI